MNCLPGWDRQQIHLLPPTVEEYVGADNPVRFIDAFVAKLDLAGAGFKVPKDNAQGRGRPAYAAACLLKLYVYGYLNQVRSSRRLEAECHRNLEVIWLMGELKPDFKTIADFRKDNASAFKAVVREFTRLCRQLDLFGGQLLAIDGTKIKASNGLDQNWSQAKLDKQLAKAEAKLEEYLKALEQSEASESKQSVIGAAELQAKVAKLEQSKAQIQERLRRLAQSGESQLSMTDSESRGMKGPQGHMVGYNVQGCVDAKHHLLVCTDVLNTGADQGQLAPVAKQAKRELQIQSADVVADSGYFKSEDIKTCQDNGLEPHLAAVNNSPSERTGLYGKEAFKYDAGRDHYVCPAGVELKPKREMEDKGRKVVAYANRRGCAHCALQARCTKSQYRTVSRWEHEESLQRMAAKVRAAPEKLAARKTIIEHCWATVKWLLPGGFLVRGKLKVGAEVSLAHFGYNLKRALAVVGMEKLMATLPEFQA